MFQCRNPYNVFVAILVKKMTPKKHFEITWPLATIADSSSTSDYNVATKIVVANSSWQNLWNEACYVKVLYFFSMYNIHKNALRNQYNWDYYPE